MLTKTKEVTVSYEPGADGKTPPDEKLVVVTFTPRQIYHYIEKLGERDMPGAVALNLGKPVEWIDTLTMQSYTALVDAVRTLNFHLAVALMKVCPIATARLLPVLNDMIAARGKGGDEKSPEPNSTESAVETPSAS
jgi:hypothetical protein